MDETTGKLKGSKKIHLFMKIKSPAMPGFQIINRSENLLFKEHHFLDNIEVLSSVYGRGFD